jgi:hypothetical protein
LVILLVAFHSWTGYGVDRVALRMMQTGIAMFLAAVPIDVVNHAVNGLDITAWSVSHALLYLGTAVMLGGVVRGWSRYGTGRVQAPLLVLLWAFVLENVWFPAQQQEYGVLAVAAWDREAADAEPILLQFAADIAFLGALPVVLRLLLGAALVGLAAAGGATLQATWAALPPIAPAGFVTGALVLAASGSARCCWSAALRRCADRRQPEPSWGSRLLAQQYGPEVLLQPARHRGAEARHVALQAVVAPQHHHLVSGSGIGTAERVGRTLHHEHRDGRCGQLVQSVLLRLARWMDGKREAQHADGTACRGRPAGHAGPGAAAPEQHRQRQLRTDVLHHCEPGRVELGGGSGRPATGHPVGLLDQHDVYSGGDSGARRSEEVRCAHPTARAVSEQEHGRRIAVGVVPGDPGRAVRRPDLGAHGRTPK